MGFEFVWQKLEFQGLIVNEFASMSFASKNGVGIFLDLFGFVYIGN